MSSDDDLLNDRDEELLRGFSTAPTAQDRAESLRLMYAEKRIGPLKVTTEFRAGVEWFGAMLTTGDEGSRLVSLATLERIRSLSNELEHVVDSLVAAGLEAPIGSLAACDSAEDRARVAIVIGRHRPLWAIPLLAQIAVLEPVGGKVSKVRAAAIEALLDATGSLETCLLTLAVALEPAANPATTGDMRRLAFLVREVRTALGNRRAAVGESPGKALARMSDTAVPRAKGTLKPEQVHDAAEEVALLMHEIVRSRVSFVVDPSTYSALSRLRDWMHALGGAAWAEFARSSAGLSLLREDLAEAIVIRALSKIPDDMLFQRLQAACESPEAARALGRVLAQREGISAPLQRWLQHGEIDFDSGAGPHEQLRAESEIGRIAQLLQDSERLDSAASQVRDAVLSEIELVAPRLMAPLRNEQNLVQSLVDAARALAAGRGLRLHGVPGEVTAYLPSHHRVVGGSLRGVTQVRIVSAAVEDVAADGTIRVVVPAIVEAVTR